MQMQNDINLLTREEKTEQFKERAVKLSSVFTIVLFVIVAGVSGYFWMQARDLRKQVAARETEIADLRSRIKSMADIEIVARNLYKKYTVVQTLFDKRLYYSTLLSHFNGKIPEGVRVNSFSFKGDDLINISGVAPNYLSVSQFLRNITSEAPEFRVFESAALNSVTLNSSSNTVDYLIVITFDPEVLKNGR